MRKDAKTYALKLLTIKPRSKKEINEKLKQKGYNEKEIEKCIKDLECVKLLDDKSFAHSYVVSRLQKYCGKNLIKIELIKKGINNKIIEEELSQFPDEYELAKKLINRKMKMYTNLEKEKKKRRIYSLLVRNGFDKDVIERIINEIDENE
jgi:regulatory protein